MDSVHQRRFQAFVGSTGATAAADPDNHVNNATESLVTMTDDRPPLSSLHLLSGKQITGDVQFLLDFSVIGFAKCGTTSILKWLAQHPNIATFDEEVWSLKRNLPHQLVRRLYYGLPADSNITQYKRGYKNPAEITDSLVCDKYYRHVWPRTRLIISLRNPFDWFISLYNFRIQNLDSLPTPDKLVGPCMMGMKSTCTHKGNFAYHLLRLGKQNIAYDNNKHKSPFTMPDSDRRSLEHDIVNHYKLLSFNHTAMLPQPNPIFILDMSQLSDANTTRRLQLTRAMTNFLQLDTLLVDPATTPRIKPGHVIESEAVQADKTRRQVSLEQICSNPQDQALKTELLRLARTSSVWIRLVFLNAPGVYCSDKEHLQSLLAEWMVDPCGV